MKKYSFSIYFGLSTAFAFVVIITSLFISVALFRNMHNVMRQDLNNRMHDILAIGITKLNADSHALLIKPEQENSAVYNQLKRVLQEIRDGSTGVRYVYTLRPLDKKKYEFIVDAEEKADDMGHLGDVYTEADYDEFIESNKVIEVDQEFETDKWGTWLSGQAKIITKEGKFDGILGIDISAEYIVQHERKAIINIIIVEIVIILFFIWLGMFISGRVTRSLKLLEKDLLSVKDFNLDTNIEIKTMFREIRNMIYATENMKNGLKSFKKYVPAGLVSQLIKLNKEANLGGEKKEMTVLFSDIKDFTSFSEKLSLENLTGFMAEYFESLTGIIAINNGTIDKYIGDSIMAFWGAPVDMNDHAYHACKAALECQQFLFEQNARFKKEGKPEFYTRFGINSGEMIVGNFGYHERFNYTVLGDNVNLASRLEGINKIYGTNIIISDFTYQIIKEQFACRKVDVVAVKGKNTGVPIYELISTRENQTKEIKAFLDLFNEGIELYLNKKWDEAIKMMKQAQKMMPDDQPTDMIICRCNDFLKTPPDSDWDGIYRLKEK